MKSIYYFNIKIYTTSAYTKNRGNQVAHGLARAALTAVQLLYWQEVGPPLLLDLIEADARARSFNGTA